MENSMYDAIVALVSVVVGVILGSVIGWQNSIKLLNRQEDIRAKREFREFLNKLITKIRCDDFGYQGRLSKKLFDYSPFFDEAIANLNKTNRMKIYNTYQYYKHPNDPFFKTEKPLYIYNIKETDAIKISDFKHKNGAEYAIANIKKISDLLK